MFRILRSGAKACLSELLNGLSTTVLFSSHSSHFPSGR
jgi:hypothetical protein